MVIHSVVVVGGGGVVIDSMSISIEKKWMKKRKLVVVVIDSMSIPIVVVVGRGESVGHPWLAACFFHHYAKLKTLFSKLQQTVAISASLIKSRSNPSTSLKI